MDEAELERRVRLANELSLPDEALDDAVHDCAQDETLGELNGTDAKDVQEDLISSSEERASKINNGGIKSQIEYLLQHNDAATVEQLIREKAE
jgi:polyhydroxyalkanoate synthesis regulator phasin